MTTPYQDQGIVPIDAEIAPVAVPSADHTALVEELIAAVRKDCEHEALPEATYRLQFNARFTFRDAAAIAEYLSRLGISHLYASPYLRARAGSMHGYDVVNQAMFNPEIGSDADFEAFVDALHQHHLKHILDVVPNHMWVGSDENPWWQDLLENGPSSCYARYFDVDWHPIKPDLMNKVLLPVLGDQFGTVLEEGQLRLHYEDGAFHVDYWGRKFPIGPRSSLRILKDRVELLQERLGSEHPAFVEYQSIITAISHLPPSDVIEPELLHERQREKEVIKRRLARLCVDEPAVRSFLDETIAHFNGQPGKPESFNQLDELLQDQPYRLSYWRVAADEINYRRFFDINELAAVCVERPEVFKRTHERVLQLLDRGHLDGLRIDHADGLFDPTGYLQLLQESRFLQRCRKHDAARNMAGPEWDELVAPLLARFQSSESVFRVPPAAPLYLVVEKILLGSETLPEDWPVLGTTGYDFLNQLNGIFVASENARAFEQLYARSTKQKTPFHEIVYACKRLILKVSMACEVNLLGHQLDRISEQNRRSRDYTLNGLTHAMREIAACFPIYRTYATAGGISERDRRYVERAVALAKRHNPSTSHAVFDFVRDVLLMADQDLIPPERLAERQQFVGRFQQFTGPTTAKAVEDTAFYIYNRLLSLKEVGGDPEKFGESISQFHAQNVQRRERYPFSLLATSTHDTKRSEDVRARINVLSELPVEWRTCVHRWAQKNKSRKVEVDGAAAPSPNEEYLLYQTLLGTWPFEPLGDRERDVYIERMQQYMIKALREAKVSTSWIAPNEAYERATSEFIRALLTDDSRNSFPSALSRFASRVSRQGMWNALSQTLLKLTSPGVPDFYQGTELWDFSLVDPDNRRPVDFVLRERLLGEMDRRWQHPEGRPPLVKDLLANAEDGRIKLFLIGRILRLRRRYPQLFSAGEYLPIEVRGASSELICAFARRDAAGIAIVVAPVRTALLCGPEATPPCGDAIWTDTTAVLPGAACHREFVNILTGDRSPFGEQVRMGEFLESLPVGLWWSPNDAKELAALAAFG
jgi:(1->4)-alpha-D-glucan 1-alpha-D-glucosylmutase